MTKKIFKKQFSEKRRENDAMLRNNKPCTVWDGGVMSQVLDFQC